MIIPAIITPNDIAGKADFILISNRAAIKEPDHAPVPGRGMATNKRRPQTV